MPIDERQPTQFEQTIADFYNAQPPVEQRRLDRKLQQIRAKQIASAPAIFFLFPGLKAKTLKTKEPARG